MMEFLHSAYTGWINYITQGKLVGLFLLLLLIYWFYKREFGQKSLMRYATVAAVCCIFPATAALLMSYQTRFYNYEWVWSIVPVTVVAACGMIFLWDELCRIDKKEKKLTRVAMVCACVALFLLAGSMGEKKQDSDSAYLKVLYPWGTDVREADIRQEVISVLEQVEQVTGGGDICLWAPIEIMEYAREKNAHIRLLYGRNMWDVSLSGYAYDTYGEDVHQLYLWMDQADGNYNLGDDALIAAIAALPSAEVCVQTAVGAGVNCIILPGNVDASAVETAEKLLGAKAQLIEEYWMIYG